MNIPPKDMKTGFIRYSTDIDLEEILLWLEDQDRASVDGTFHCNRNLTIESHNAGELLVYIDSETNKAIAYQWGGLITPGILEVRADKRRQGIGKALTKKWGQETRNGVKSTVDPCSRNKKWGQVYC